MSDNSPLNKFIADVKAFHEKFGLAYDGKPRVLDAELGAFRLGFMREELDEWALAQQKFETHDALQTDEGLAPQHEVVVDVLEQQLDAMIDLAYVLFGTVYKQGLAEKFEAGWDRVQNANMAKVRTERAEDSKRGSTFDVIKPAGWVPPNHSDLVSDHAHK